MNLGKNQSRIWGVFLSSLSIQESCNYLRNDE